MGLKATLPWLSFLTGVTLVVTSACVAPVYADDLDAEQVHAESVVGQAQVQVGLSSSSLTNAAARVEAAQNRVVAAQEAWEAIQADLARAQLAQAERAKELYRADQALKDAQAREEEGQRAVDEQQDAVVEYALAVNRDNYPLMSIALLLDSHSTATLSNRIQWRDTVLTTNQIDLDYLREIQEELAQARAANEAARLDAEKARQAAEDQVTMSERAEQAAAYARMEVQAALQEAQDAQAAASLAYAHDQSQLAQALTTLDSVNSRIAERARLEEEARRAEEARLAEEARRAAEAAANQSSPAPQPIQPPSQPSPPPPSAGSLSSAQAQSVAYGMVLDRGWDDSQFTCLVWLWNRESGWRWNAENPYSGAYGIPQSLPASKMASVGADYRTNAVTQITWGLLYISQRYGTPCGAWAHSEDIGWY